MAAIASAELGAELERIVRACPARSRQVLRRVADLPAATAGHLDRQRLDTFAPIAEAA